jgi:hypothetical protein
MTFGSRADYLDTTIQSHVAMNFMTIQPTIAFSQHSIQEGEAASDEKTGSDAKSDNGMRAQKSESATLGGDVISSLCGQRREKLHVSFIIGQSIRDKARMGTRPSRSAHISGGNSLALVLDWGSRSQSRGIIPQGLLFRDCRDCQWICRSNVFYFFLC